LLVSPNCGDGGEMIAIKYYSFIISAVFLFSSVSLSAEGTTESASDNQIGSVYEPYQQLLDRFLMEKELPGDGFVSAFRYQQAKESKEAESLLNKQREQLARFDTSQLDTRDKAVSFWINAYNFFMIAHILENPDRSGKLVKSVRDYGSFFNPYRVFRKSIFNVGGTNYSLAEIEKEILLGDEYQQRGWKEARVHFAVNCASVGCPPLISKIYTPDNLETLLTNNTRRALNTERHLKVEDNTLYLTELFKWYSDDYIEEEGSIESFIKKYADDRVATQISNTSRIRYIDYDWDLNSPENFPEIQ